MGQSNLNSLTDPIVLTTNFGFLKDFKLSTTINPKAMQIKFHAAYLLSSFGQIQLELLAGNQEGMRKLEVAHLKKLFVPDSSDIDVATLNNINAEFDILASNPSNFVGVEGVDGPRKKLDLAIATYLFSQNQLNFSSVEDFTKAWVENLTKIVQKRRP